MDPHILIICPNDDDTTFIKDAGQLALAAHSSGLNVSILSSLNEGSPLEELEGVTVHYLHKGNFFKASNQTNALKEILENDGSINVVHHLNLSKDMVPIFDVCRKLGVTIAATMRDEKVLDASNIPFWKKKHYRTMIESISPIIVTSDYLLQKAKEAGYSMVAYIPEGVQTERFKPVLSKRPIRRALNLPESATLVCCMASVHPDNNQLDVLNYCHPLSDFLYVLFIGDVKDEKYYQELQDEIKRKQQSKHVIFRQAVENPEDYFKASDVFMLMGGIETRRATVLEALSTGLPVILAPSPSSFALTNSNKCGIVLQPNNALAKQGVEKLLTDPNYRQGRAVHARPYVKKEFSFTAMLESYIKLYRSL